MTWCTSTSRSWQHPRRRRAQGPRPRRGVDVIATAAAASTSCRRCSASSSPASSDQPAATWRLDKRIENQPGSTDEFARERGS
jgi:hypothetical protein